VKLSLKALAFLVGTTLVSLVFILAHDALTQSRYFNARTITVDGNQRVSLERILELGQINVGDNILAMNLKLLRQRLLNNPWIADVELERELPDTVHIVVKEHIPAAIVHFDRDYFVSSTGQIIGAVSEADKIDVPRLTGLTIADFASKSTRRSPESTAFLKVVELSCLDGSILPLHKIERIDIDPQIGVTLSAFENRIAIKLGKSGYTGKFNRIRDMIAYLREGEHLRHVACIDLNDLDRVVVGAVEKKSLLGVCYRKET
jgi:cell division protein FtsQ